MHIFYQPVIDSEFIQVDEEESKHIVRVLRIKKGENVRFTNGIGWQFQCTMLDDHPKRCLFHVHDKRFFQQDGPHIHIAVAPTKNIARFEWFIEKAVEIGIGEITPMLCDHSERNKLNAERLEKIAISAMKQSSRKWLPKINEVISFDDFLSHNHPAKKAVAYVSEHHTQLLQNHYQKGEDALILIGPEGDFSNSEIEKALKKDFFPVSLGESRLRTETAALVACQTIVFINH